MTKSKISDSNITDHKYYSQQSNKNYIIIRVYKKSREKKMLFISWNEWNITKNVYIQTDLPKRDINHLLDKN